MGEKIRQIERRLQNPIFSKEPGRHLQFEQTRDDMRFLLSECERLEARVKELEEERDTLKFNFDKMIEVASDQLFAYRGEQKKVKELVEGIEKHKKKYEIVEMFDEKIVKRYITNEDAELYKLVERETP
ncbi:MAG: hypothetical protein IMZ43_09530 [Thermoplasmata archaeon]|nr:hypothetical protein [Thermoplasmata archaeon]